MLRTCRRECNARIYEEHLQEFEPFELIHNVRVFPNGGTEVRDSVVWGDGERFGNSLHIFQGEAYRMSDLAEGQSLGEGAWFLTVSRSDNCDMDPCVDGVAWTYSIQGYYDNELLMPSEERLRS